MVVHEAVNTHAHLGGRWLPVYNNNPKILLVLSHDDKYQITALWSIISNVPSLIPCFPHAPSLSIHSWARNTMFSSQQWIKYLVQDLSQEPFGEVRPLSSHHLSTHSSLTILQGFSLHTTVGNLVWKWGTLCHCVIVFLPPQWHRLTKLPLIVIFIFFKCKSCLGKKSQFPNCFPCCTSKFDPKTLLTLISLSHNLQSVQH